MCKVSTIEGCLTAWLNSSSSGERAAIWEGLKQITHVELCILLFLSFSTLSGSKSCSLAPVQQHSLLLPPGSVWPWQQAQKGGSVSLAEDEGGWLVYLFWGGMLILGVREGWMVVQRGNKNMAQEMCLPQAVLSGLVAAATWWGVVTLWQCKTSCGRRKSQSWQYCDWKPHLNRLQLCFLQWSFKDVSMKFLEADEP